MKHKYQTPILLCSTVLALLLPMNPAKYPTPQNPEIITKGSTVIPLAEALEPPKPQEFTQLETVPVSVKDIAYSIAESHGWTGSEWEALVVLWGNESSWNTNALNPSSGACGIPQALPCSKIGDNWRDPETQLRWGAQYIKSRYGSPSQALYFWEYIAPTRPPYNGHWY